MFLLKHRPHYFSYHLNREVEEVYWHGLLSSLALALVFIFEPIYLWKLNFSLVQILWFYVLLYVWYILLIGFGAKFASRFGYKHAIFVSNIFYVAYWISLFLIDEYRGLFFIAPIFFALQKSWFWPAWDADVSISSRRVQRGRVVGMFYALVQGAFILGPILGGLVSERLGFLSLFILAAVLMMLSAFPLFRSPEIYTKHEFKFKNLWATLKEYKQNFFGYWGYAEDLMVMSLWPVYMFIVIPDIVDVGFITTIATLVGTVLMLYIGKLTDRIDKRRLTQVSSLLYALTWIFRFLGKTPVGVLVMDSVSRTGKDVMNVPMVALTFDRAGSRGPDHAIAYSVFYEFSLSVGKIVTALAGIVILSLTGNIFLVFGLVGVLTLMYGLLK